MSLPNVDDAYSERSSRADLRPENEELVQKKILLRASYEQMKNKIIAKQK